MADLFVFVDLALIEESLQNSSNDFLVAIADRLRPIVVLHVECFRKIEKLLRNALDEFSRKNAGFRSGLLHLLAVLIHTGQEKYIFAFQPMIACDHISKHHLVSVPDVRRRVRVIDRGGDEKCLRHWLRDIAGATLSTQPATVAAS